MNGYVLAALLFLLGAVGATSYHYGDKHATAREVLKARADMDDHLAADRKAEADAAAEIKTLNEDLTLAQTAAGTAYEKGKNDAEQKGERVAADLRSGNLRLRAQWAGCEAARHQGDGTAVVAGAGAAARDREESAGRIIRAAAQCDAQVIGLQEAYNSMRDLFNKQVIDSSRR